MLLTHEEALIPHGALGDAASFIEELTRRLRAAAAAAAVAATKAAAAAAAEERRSAAAAAAAAAAAESPMRTPRTPLSAHAPGAGAPPAHVEEEAPLPFEFVVVDTALEFACAGLETTVQQLEHETPAALEALGITIDGQTLQRVRTLKGIITRTEGRAEAVRAEIERFLNDDSDMRGMYLSRKAEARRAVVTGGGGSGGGSGLRSGAMSPAFPGRRRSSGRASPSVLDGVLAWRNRSRRVGARAGAAGSAMGSGMTTPTGGATPALRFRGGGGGGNPVFGPAPGLQRGGSGGMGGGPARSGMETPMSRRDSFGSTAMSLAGLLERLDDDADVQVRRKARHCWDACVLGSDSWLLSVADRSWRTFWRRILRSWTARARGCARWMSTCRRRRTLSTLTWQAPALLVCPQFGADACHPLWLRIRSATC